MSTDIQNLLERLKSMETARSAWMSHWQELAEYFVPRRADFTFADNPGAKRTEKQFDGTPMLAARNLAAAMDGLLKPKNARWFTIRTEDERLGEIDEVRAWLQKAETIMVEAIYDPKARFVQYSSEVDLDLVVFGTGILFIGESIGNGRLAFKSHHLKNSHIAVNEDGNVDTVFLTSSLTARQAAQRYGEENLGEDTKAALADKYPDKQFKFLRVCMPRAERDRRLKDNTNLPYAVIDIDIESEHKIAESGYHVFPYVVPRWETSTDEVYGRAPAMIALPDAKTLNQMGKTLLKAGHKAVDPPLLAPSDSLKSAVRTWPGGISYFDANVLSSSGGRVPIQPLQTGANIPLGREMQNDVREQVWNAFFRNILNLPAQGPQMTATEIMERKEEFVRVIGPVFGRLEADYTGPLVERVFNILLRNGAFGQMPEVLAGTSVKFEYASPLSKAHKLIEVGALTKTGQDLLPLVQIKPEIMDNFDADKITRDVAEANGMPLTWLVGKEGVEETRGQATQALEAAQSAEQAQQLVDGAAKLNQAGIDVNSALEGGALEGADLSA